MIRGAIPIYKMWFFYDHFDGYQLEFLLYLSVMTSIQELYIIAGYGIQQCPINCIIPKHTGAVSQNLTILLRMIPLTDCGRS
ncbi:hypothetical protein OROMI_023041 [Orobanche minor]